MSETPIVTADGVKVTDAAWISSPYAQELQDNRPPALIRAPEICIEVLSPSNTAEEMAEKRALYFESGAFDQLSHPSIGPAWKSHEGLGS